MNTISKSKKKKIISAIKSSGLFSSDWVQYSYINNPGLSICTFIKYEASKETIELYFLIDKTRVSLEEFLNQADKPLKNWIINNLDLLSD